MPVWTVGNIRFGQRGGEGGGKSVGKGDPLSDVDDRRSDNEIKSPLGHKRWVVTSDWGRGKRG